MLHKKNLKSLAKKLDLRLDKETGGDYFITAEPWNKWRMQTAREAMAFLLGFKTGLEKVQRYYRAHEHMERSK